MGHFALPSLSACVLIMETDIYFRSESLCCAQKAVEFNLARKPEPQPPLSAPSLGPGPSKGQQAAIYGCETMKTSLYLQLAATADTINVLNTARQRLFTPSNLEWRKWCLSTSPQQVTQILSLEEGLGWKSLDFGNCGILHAHLSCECVCIRPCMHIVILWSCHEE